MQPMRSRPRLLITICLALVVCSLAGAALALAAAGGSATAARVALPVGPRLAVLADSASAGTRLLTIGPDGDAPQVIAHSRSRDGVEFGQVLKYEHPNWSPDGRQLAFFGPGDETTAIYLIEADGADPHLLATSEHPGGPDNSTVEEPVYDPVSGDIVVQVVHTPHGEGLFDDSSKAKAKGKGKGAIREEFWALPPSGARPRRLSSVTVTRKGATRFHLYLPYSFAPDGKRLVATLFGGRGFSVVTVDPRGGPARVLTKATIRNEGGLEPAISPDGKEIVYRLDNPAGESGRNGLASTEWMIVPTAGGRPKLLVKVKGGARWPSWDPSGSRIAFTTLKAAGVSDWDDGPQAGNALMEVNADGTCLTTVYSAPPEGVVRGAAWQPGADRGAGPISC
jgi:dipeptidyl aminopeptidase/acylaminoacyl peptidase